MEHFFKLKEHGTDVRTEIIAGVTTFMTMAYILAVNPAMLGPDGAGMDSFVIATGEYHTVREFATLAFKEAGT